MPLSFRAFNFAAAALLTLGLCGTAQAQWTETDIQGFAGYNGSFIVGTPIQASDGNFYGAAGYGGENTTPSGISAGVLFQVVPGTSTINPLYYLCTQTNCTDGGVPNNRLVQGPDGAIYGTAQQGGANNKGVVFRITLAGSYSAIHSFCSAGECADGSAPLAGLSLAADGTFYGTTSTGGADGDGTIFSMTAAGVVTTLYSFCSESQCADGAAPESNLVQGADSTLYGVTSASGANGEGTLFSFNPAGQGTFNAIEAFCVDTCTDGAFPNNDLVIDGSGNVYGTTTYNSIDSVSTLGGLIYKVTPASQSGPATYTDFYDFCGSGACPDGNQPKGGVMQASDGNLYGTTIAGGSDSEGIAYSITTGGAEAPIYSFLNNGMDGYRPYSTFVQGNDGSLYTVTYDGGYYEGTSGFGEFVRLTHSPVLAAPVLVSVSSDIVPLGQSFTLNWSVSNAAGSLTMQQCYSFTSGGSGAGTWTGKAAPTGGSTSQGTATIKPTAAGVYTYALTCGGIESNSAQVSVTNGAKANTTTTLAVSPNPAESYQNLTLTATVAKVLESGTPTGTVKFSVGSTVLATAALNGSGVAAVTLNAGDEPYGDYPITATYSGDANDSSSVSAAQTVLLLPNTSVAVTASPASVTPPAKVTLTATVTSAQGTPTGTVTFSVPKVATLGTITLKNGVATLSASSSGVPAGTYNVLAYYNGAKSYGANGSEVQVTVK